jgi:hypothetical protein
MGAAASQESIRKKEGEIIAYHQEIDTASNSLKEKANIVKQEIIKREYNDENLICQRIVWTNIDELASFFPVETVQRPNFNAKYRLGVLPSQNIEKLLNNKKLQTCKNIASLYKAKINLLDKLINTKNCQSMAKLEWAELRGKLSKIDPNSSNLEKWSEIYNELQAFNKTIITDYKRLENHLTSIRKATSLDTLTDINKRIQNIFAEMETTCQKHASYFKSVNSSSSGSTSGSSSLPSRMVSKRLMYLISLKFLRDLLLIRTPNRLNFQMLI